MTLRATILITLLLACGAARGQYDPTTGLERRESGSMLPGPTRQAPTGVVTGEWSCGPIRQIDRSRYCSKLADIEERIQENNPYRNLEDVSNWAHETIHGINSRLRNGIGSGYGAYYVGGDRCWVFREPQFTLGQVAQRVPPELRDEKYQTYLIDSRRQMPQTIPGVVVENWEQNPLYPLDEWVAYIGGAEVVQQMYGGARLAPTGMSITHDVRACVQLESQVLAVLKAIQDIEPTYEDMDKLKAFIALNHKRVEALQQLHPQTDQIATAHFAYQQAYYRNCPTGTCPIQQRPQYQSQPVVRPIQPVPPKPTQPQQPIAQCKCGNIKGCSCSGDLLARIILLETELAFLKSRPQVAGPAGPVGPTGPQGPKGDTGAPGVSPSIDAIAGEVIKKQPPLPIRVLRSESDYDDLLVPLDGKHRANIDMREMK